MQHQPHHELPIDKVQSEKSVHMTSVVFVGSYDRHAFQGGMKAETDECHPWKSAFQVGIVAVLIVFMGMKVAMLDPLAHVFQSSLKQETKQHKDAGQFCGTKSFRHEVQEAHGNDEGASKRQNVSQIVQASLAHQDKRTTAQKGGGQENECRQEHGSGFRGSNSLGQHQSPR